LVSAPVVGTPHTLSAAGAEVKGAAEAAGEVTVHLLVAGRWNFTIAKRQASGATNGTLPSYKCRLRLKTSVWHGSADVHWTFTISLDEFRQANLALGPNCVGFVLGKRYCICQGMASSHLIISCVGPCSPLSWFSTSSIPQLSSQVWRFYLSFLLLTNILPRPKFKCPAVRSLRSSFKKKETKNRHRLFFVATEIIFEWWQMC
jgi:hypothetical protein